MSFPAAAVVQRLLYRAASGLLVPLFALVLLARSIGRHEARAGFLERFGFGARVPQPAIWLHAVSVGEVQAAAPLLRSLRARHPGVPLVLTCCTVTGRARARALFSGQALVRYLPFDLAGSVRRFLDRVQPRVAVILETELWPQLYRACDRRRIPLVLASARLSARSVERYRALGALFSEALRGRVLVAAQADADAERFRALGADPATTSVAGNLKYDIELPEGCDARGQALRARHVPGRPVWVAGSTHAGEEAQLLEAHARLRASQPDAVLVLAPRHPPRFDAVAALLSAAKVSFARRSAGLPEPLAPAVEVLLLDTLGELLDFYVAGDVAFVGGTLVPVGGHNLLEPAALGRPVLVGPFTGNAPEVARQLASAGAVREVNDVPGLAAELVALLADPQRRARMGAAGQEVVAANRGTVDRLLELIEPLLAPQPGAQRAGGFSARRAGPTGRPSPRG